jgi:hypothetical protein
MAPRQRGSRKEEAIGGGSGGSARELGTGSLVGSGMGS